MKNIYLLNLLLLPDSVLHVAPACLKMRGFRYGEQSEEVYTENWLGDTEIYRIVGS